MRSLLLAAALAAADAPLPKLPVVPVPPPSARRAEGPRPTPPSLSPGALAAELRDGARRRADDLAALRKERERLEALAAEIAAARKALREETARLDAVVARAKAETRRQHDEAARATAALARLEALRAQGKALDDGTLPDAKSVETLARTLKGMKPDQAAGVVGQLERPLAAAVLRKLKPADAAAVLGRMKTPDAAALFTMLAKNDAGAAK